jgi:hypothetical protein
MHIVSCGMVAALHVIKRVPPEDAKTLTWGGWLPQAATTNFLEVKNFSGLATILGCKHHELRY